jgi:dienelactone hydrolase
MGTWRWGIGLLALAGLAHAGPHSFAVATGTVDLAGSEQQVDVYRPGLGRPVGVAIVAHGWTRSRARHSDLGRALAEAGVTAVIPDLPNVMNLWGNGDAIVELVYRLEGGALGLPPIERSRLVLIGTSAGGLATLLASADLPGIAGWIGLDPVDRTGTGKDAAARVAAPAVVMLAEPSGCNLFGSGSSLARALPHRLRTQRFDGATHCDFEAPTNNVCRALCGTSTDALQEAIRNATVEATLELLTRLSISALPPSHAGWASPP